MKKRVKKLAKDLCRTVGHESKGVICERCDEILLPVGTLLPFVGEKPPKGFMPCDGRKLKASEYTELKAIMGMMYGAGEGDLFFIPKINRSCIKVI